MTSAVAVAGVARVLLDALANLVVNEFTLEGTDHTLETIHIFANLRGFAIGLSKNIELDGSLVQDVLDLIEGPGGNLEFVFQILF